MTLTAAAPPWDQFWRFWFSVVMGAVAVLLFLVMAWVVTQTTTRPATGRRDWLGLIDGNDHRLSTSKLQWFLWTAMVAYAFVGISAARYVLNFPNLPASLPSPPPNILIALGFSSVTMATAKGVTTGFVAGGRVSKTPVATPAAGDTPPGGLLTDDTGAVDLSKVQLLLWTVVALAVYLYATILRLAQGGNEGLPDIDAALMVLTGLSMGGYLGKKLVTTTETQVAITTMVPSTAAPDVNVTVYGTNLGKGTTQDDKVLVDNCEVEKGTVRWEPDKLSFPVPPRHPCGHDWKANEEVTIRVLVGGQQAQGTGTLTVAKP